MLVEDLMTRDVETCRAESDLAEAAAVMWRRDCGAVPVVDGGGLVVGMITDRDICMALAMRGQRAADVKVGEVMSRDVQTCTPVDDVREALEVMRRHQLRRLPVVNSHGQVAGVLSICDVVRRTKKGKGKRRVSRRDTVATLKAIYAPHGTQDAAAEDDDGESSSGNHKDETPPGGDASHAAPVDDLSAARD
jgi:CBS domain-containing protein